MHAYVFWHAPRDDVDPFSYAASVGRFHAALADDPPCGFVGSFTTRVSRVPWLEADAGYEDWYILTGSAALDPLDRAALDARRREVHDGVARQVRIGMGGLYRLVRGKLIVPRATDWFAKSEGTTYPAFAGVLDAVARAGATVWQRQMVLGPAPEFAAQTDGATPFVGGVDSLRVRHVSSGPAKLA